MVLFLLPVLLAAVSAYAGFLCSHMRKCCRTVCACQLASALSLRLSFREFWLLHDGDAVPSFFTGMLSAFITIKCMADSSVMSSCSTFHQPQARYQPYVLPGIQTFQGASRQRLFAIGGSRCHVCYHLRVLFVSISFFSLAYLYSP